MIKKTDTTHSPPLSGHERLRASEDAFNRQLAQNRQAAAQAKASVRRVRPWWLVGGGLLAGAVVATLPTRAVAAAVGAAAGFAVRLMATPVGPMAIGALLGTQQQRPAPEGDAATADAGVQPESAAAGRPPPTHRPL